MAQPGPPDLARRLAGRLGGASDPHAQAPGRNRLDLAPTQGLRADRRRCRPTNRARAADSAARRPAGRAGAVARRCASGWDAEGPAARSVAGARSGWADPDRENIGSGGAPGFRTATAVHGVLFGESRIAQPPAGPAARRRANRVRPGGGRAAQAAVAQHAVAPAAGRVRLVIVSDGSLDRQRCRPQLLPLTTSSPPTSPDARRPRASSRRLRGRTTRGW